jgi:LmbE family N-acetylglucosaminyl deacetylase
MSDRTGHERPVQTIAALLEDPLAAPLRPPEFAASLGSTLVVAPHPDDESLGCGGAIALLRRHSVPVWTLFVTDGAASHTRSVRYPPPALAALREEEALAALSALGVKPDAVTFLRMPDRALPTPDSPEYVAPVKHVREIIAERAPQTVLLPWRRDPHPDHRGAAQLVRAALAQLPLPPRVLEYPIWLWHLAQPGDGPAPHEVIAWRLDIAPVLEEKRAAIAAHRSQTIGLADDPSGFRLTSDLLAPFVRPWELYFEEPGPDSSEEQP